MKRLLLLSNGRLAGQEPLEFAREWIAEHFQVSSASPKSILFVPYASLDDHDAYEEKVASALAPLGITIISAHHLADPVAHLDKVDGVLIGGGNSFQLLDQLYNKGLLDVIKQKVEDGLPYMGISAGTNVAAPTIQTTNDMPIIMPRSLDAMHLVPFQINVHYVDGAFYSEEDGEMVRYNGETRAQRIDEFHKINHTPVIGLKEGTGLRIVDHHIEILGGKGATLFEQGKESAHIDEYHL